MFSAPVMARETELFCVGRQNGGFMAMRPKVRLLLITVILVCLAVFVSYKLVSKQHLIDKCLDEGGRWNASTLICDK